MATSAKIAVSPPTESFEQAITRLTREALPFGRLFTAAGVKSGRWDALWAERNGMASKEARAIAVTAYRTRRSVADVAAGMGLGVREVRS